MSKSTGRAPKLAVSRPCEQCGGPIPPEKLKNKPNQQYCCRECCIQARIGADLYRRMGELGNQSQARTKQETGTIPHYEKRSAAVAQSNRENPRRKRG